jgi:predicted AlkP superfamily pyrophosphatase or phosphodiesterase
MKLLFIVIIFIYTVPQNLFGQSSQKPKLIVGIVVDQMRAEYLYRFQDNYTENGFKRLIREGFNVKNMHFNYIPTATGPGHASIFTGTTPANHGIVANNWYSNEENRKVYCAEDTTATLVDNPLLKKSNNINEYSRSPKRLMVSTITDELKLFTNGRSKVIGISMKDRGAIFPSGHMSDGAYWYHSGNGNFITSSYYKQELPDWLVAFNKRNVADSLLNLVWKPLLPIVQYKNSNPDDSPLEKIYNGRKKSTFPYDLKNLRIQNGNLGMISEVPFGNSLLTKMVIATIDGEQLGRHDATDFLTLSYSSTDYVGHYFGIRSKELEDTYVRLDRELDTLLDYLDKTLGKENYLLFLTADHAASDHPEFLKPKKLPGETFNINRIKEDLSNYLSTEFGPGNYISNISPSQIYLDHSVSSNETLLKKAFFHLKKLDGIKEVYVPRLKECTFDNGTIGTFMRNSYNFKNSGDILLHFEPGWMQKRNIGTTHGTAHSSDTHVPMLWYGWQIPKGETIKPHTITQIVPTLSMLLNIPLTDASDKNPIEEIFE